MKLRVLITTFFLSAAAFIGAPTAALAQSDCKTLVKASPFGPDDEVGATNRVTPAVTKAAAAEIQTGDVIPMAYNLVDGVPLFGTRFTKTILTSATLVPGAELGKNKLSYMEDTYLSQSHVGTHIDGLGHIARIAVAQPKLFSPLQGLNAPRRDRNMLCQSLAFNYPRQRGTNEANADQGNFRVDHSAHVSAP